MTKSGLNSRKNRKPNVKKPLYTILLEYHGGTYVTQVATDSVGEALSALASQTKRRDLATWGITRAELERVAKEDSLVAVSGCVGVWCASGSAKHGLILINIIDTRGTVGLK